MAKYKAYPEYKDSGVEWLGEIPEDWSVTKLKYIADLLTAKSTNSDDLFVGLENISSGDGKYISKEENIADGASVSFEKNDVLFGKLRPYLAKSWLATFSGVCSSEFLVLRTAKLHPKYLNYYSLTNEFIEQVNSSTYGSKMPRASWEFIGLLPVPTCSYSLSEKVACFLDHETAKIDKLIERQQQLIELLKEKRQAVISHAVTKGLNPGVPMKDSGVEWLGEVPEHWIVSGFKKYLSSIVDYRGKTPNKTDGGILLVTARNIKKGVLDYTLSQEFIAPSDYKEVMSRGLPDIGDVLFTTEAPLGEVANVDRVDIALAQRIIKFKGMTSHLDNYYFKYFIMSSAFQQSLNLYSSGSTAQGIKAERFVYLRKLLPPINEQMEIVGFLDKEITKIDILVEQQFVMLSLLQERRTALISAAVTGKIDVRDWVAPNTQDIEESQEATA